MNKIKTLLILCLTLTANQVSANLCTPDKRYIKAGYFSDDQLQSLKDITYSKATDFLGKKQDLKMDIYFPNKKIDKVAQRPFILLIHGGGFRGGNRDDMTDQAKDFAKRGFVVATMNYRLGFDQKDKAGLQKAVYRAQQDSNSALAYIASQAETLNVDTSWFFVGGGSAGAITSLMTKYASQSDWNKVLPQFESKLGALKSEKSSLKQNYSIKGIYNFKGAILPNLIISDVLIPTISFQHFHRTPATATAILPMFVITGAIKKKVIPASRLEMSLPMDIRCVLVLEELLARTLMILC